MFNYSMYTFKRDYEANHQKRPFFQIIFMSMFQAK